MANGNGSTSASIGLLLMRLGAGGMLLYGHGWSKFTHYAERAAHFPDPLGVGHARSLVLAIFAELVCSIFVILGFGTRFAVVPILIMMGVAAFVVNGGKPFGDKELALVYAVPFVTLLFTGPGRFALDARFGPRVTFKGGK